MLEQTCFLFSCQGGVDTLQLIGCPGASDFQRGRWGKEEFCWIYSDAGGPTSAVTPLSFALRMQWRMWSLAYCSLVEDGNNDCRLRMVSGISLMWQHVTMNINLLIFLTIYWYSLSQQVLHHCRISCCRSQTDDFTHDITGSRHVLRSKEQLESLPMEEVQRNRFRFE